MHVFDTPLLVNCRDLAIYFPHHLVQWWNKWLHFNLKVLHPWYPSGVCGAWTCYHSDDAPWTNGKKRENKENFRSRCHDSTSRRRLDKWELSLTSLTFLAPFHVVLIMFFHLGSQVSSCGDPVTTTITWPKRHNRPCRPAVYISPTAEQCARFIESHHGRIILLILQLLSCYLPHCSHLQSAAPQGVAPGSNTMDAQQ